MATNANLTFPNYADWVSGGTYQVDINTGVHSRQDDPTNPDPAHSGVNTPLDPKDKNMPGYYTNYQNAVTDLINAGDLAQAKAVVTSHGQSWTDPVVVAESSTTSTSGGDTTTSTSGGDTSTTTASTYDGPATQGTVESVAAPVVEPVVTEPFNMAKLTDNMDLTNKLQEIISTNSPLFKAAQTKAMQNMQRRGLVNSTLAQEAVMNSVINVALPIAQAEVNQLVTNLYYNTDWTNKQKMQANEAAYNKMLTQLQGSINFTLQQLTGSQNIGIQNLAGQQQMDVQTLRGSQAIDLQTLVGKQQTKLQQDEVKANLWAKYGDWVTAMATTEGADQEAWQNMLDMLKSAGGWPKPT